MANSAISETVSPSEKETVAQRLIGAWCDTRKCTTAHIPSKMRQLISRRGVGVLVYALRKVAHVDIIPTANLLGIEPSEFMDVSRDMRILIEESKDPYYMDIFNRLLVIAGLREAEEKTDPAPVPKRGTTEIEDRRRKAAAKKRTAEREARARELTEWRKQIARQVCEILDLSYETAFSQGSLLPDLVRARSLAYAVMSASGEPRQVAEISRSFGTTKYTVSSSLWRIDKILRAEGMYEGLWQEKIAKVCREFKIPTDSLLLSPKI